ncbi:MAG TPA: S49 family peptidase [Bauldia sp.]|nr:S49 family peptidase [Bauldia sp.]
MFERLRIWFGRRRAVVPVVRLSGAIGMPMPLRSGISLASVEGPLQRAFALKSAPAVAILINSPGGSAVQSHLIYKRIRKLAEENRKPVIVAVEDVAASGGYMIALAGDEIVVDGSSIVGSIGVVSASFGFQKLIEKLGIERRVHTAGTSKSMLDPFLPEREEDVARLAGLQQEVHGAFIDLVRSRRTALADDPDLFTGAFWSGARAVKLGLADRVGELREVVSERYGADVILRPLGAERGFIRRRLGLGSPPPAAAMLESVVAFLEERLLWDRYGL